MPTISVTTTFAADQADAIARVAQYVEGGEHRLAVAGFATTGRVSVRSERHAKFGMFEVELEDLGGDRDDLWVVLTSYGMSPGSELGSVWQTVAGVGR